MKDNGTIAPNGAEQWHAPTDMGPQGWSSRWREPNHIPSITVKNAATVGLETISTKQPETGTEPVEPVCRDMQPGREYGLPVVYMPDYSHLRETRIPVAEKVC